MYSCRCKLANVLTQPDLKMFTVSFEASKGSNVF